MRERYEPGSGFLYRLDARVKLLMTLALLVGILLTPDRAFPAYPLLWAVLGCLAVVSRIRPGRLARLGGFALPFVLAAATLPFTVAGQPVASFFGLTVTDAGLVRFISVLLKSWLSVQAALLLTLTTPVPDLLWALGRLHVPAALVSIMGFMYRYLFTLSDEAQRLLRARAARSGRLPGSKPGGSLRWRAQTAGGLVGSLFLRSYERSERVYQAMLARGYSGHALSFNPAPVSRTALAFGALPVGAVILIEVLARVWWAA